MRSAVTARGACLCGAVRFEVDFPTKWCAHCHCSMCRRAHGAAYVTWFGVEAAQFHILTGDDALVRYQSSAEATRSFCRTCGSSLFFQSIRWPGEVHVALACLQDPIDREPEAHAFFDDRAPWVRVDDDLPKLGTPSSEPSS